MREKNRWWSDNFVVHNLEVEGPFPNGNQFIILWRLDATCKATGKRMQIASAGLYAVAQGKVVREQFFYEAK
ncbi:MAG: nuclear transport factor 2 family protein [Acidobacteria bacterium]|nr:nuclear transport factor 2 family protein [Acidobacteriota bacterium]